MHGIGTAHRRPPCGVDDAPGVPTERLDGPTYCGSKAVSARRLFLPQGLPGLPVAPPDLGTIEGQYGGLDLMLKGALRLLCGGGAKDVL
jgi:hypothetical protein